MAMNAVKVLLSLVTGAIVGAIQDYPRLPARDNFQIVSSPGKVREEDAFLVGRPGVRVPPAWSPLFVSSAPGFIDPGEFPRILEEIVKSLRENPKRAVVITCPEYLALYNGFRALLKFLHTVRDYAMLNGGRVYLVTDKDVWNEKEYAMLTGLEV
ncbi:DUF835 domain-containing protein [Thermococcus sp. Bubb.Bath]|uniref:DUF835 domain-containing protein n=1 Tax=Thermococcus sp. Bubb.Bath TaxID=1638242 RepID=UPI001439F939|nr:DUF835 domain-containing protein [Thermococcus sp. Bubb.Bath]NJF26034.1 DUF835 domain-containing protein [Thermococcus sp. Bubb.Bath]